MKAILKNEKHPAFIGALKWATENGYGKAKESVEVNGGITVKLQYVDDDE